MQTGSTRDKEQRARRLMAMRTLVNAGIIHTDVPAIAELGPELDIEQWTARLIEFDACFGRPS